MSKVFLSHSHADRDTASYLDKVLRQNNVQVFFDQREIEPGEVLPERIENGVQWCTLFLLLWSSSASRSIYVNMEWNSANNRRKTIVPYKLDSTPLPVALENLVYISIEDQGLANAKLLKAVIGKDFTSSPDKIFPGAWRVILKIPNLSHVIHELNLMPNGQISGVGWIDNENKNVLGYAAQLIGIFKPEVLAKMKCIGKWNYSEDSQLLSLNITTKHAGMQSSEAIHIRMTGYEAGLIHASGPYGRQYTFERIKNKM